MNKTKLYNFLIGGTKGTEYASVFVQAESKEQAIRIGELQHGLSGCHVIDWDGNK